MTMYDDDDAAEDDLCPRCGVGVLVGVTGYPDYRGRCPVYLVCEDNCGYEKEVGTDSVL